MPSPQEQESPLVALALERPVAERKAFLQAVCGSDRALRQRLDALLAAHDRPDDFVPTQAEAARPTLKHDLAADAPDETVGQTLGRYKLLERVGEGGCGVVYVAEQTQPVRRRVALKVIKLGMDTKQVVARFEAERQALAMMDHPNIAKVLDAGMTGDPEGSAGCQPAVSPAASRPGVGSSSASARLNVPQAGSLRHEPELRAGRPFFVMELVRGIKITDYCDQANLTTKERLDLFIKVCQAIQHAHQKGIIHRDIKPSNILVTLHDGVPVPKVIDFGIAKATEGRLTDSTVYTQLHQFIGTPAYMSPEQAEMSGLDIDTRSDIYSLGVLLYELLVGSTPFDGQELMASGLDAMRKTIREKEPLRPSTKLSQILVAAEVTRRTSGNAEASASSTRRLQEQLHQLKGDLDWIVMKCLEKDRQRRYETANGLAADLKRHLDNEPVLARPPSAAYKFQKAYRRNKLVFAAGGVVMIGLLIVLAALAFALVRESALKSESARADSIATFVTGMLNDSVPQLVLQGNSKGIRVLLESADRLVTKTLTNSPAAELAVRDALQMFYNGRLADFQSAREQLDRMEVLLPLVADERLPHNHSRNDLRIDIVTTRFWAGATTQGQAELEKLADKFKQRGPAANRARARTLASLGNSLLVLNKPLEAEVPLAEAYRMETGRNGPGFFSEDFAGDPYSSALIRNRKFSLAEEVARTTVNRISAELANPEPWKATVELAANLGHTFAYPLLVQAQCLLGKFREAETLVAEQLGPGAAQPWSQAQRKAFKRLQLGVQAWSGRWREAAPGLILLATNSLAEVGDWGCGMAAAVATGDTNAYDRLGRWGRARYVGNAEADSAESLFSAVILRPQEEDLSHTLPDLLRRMEDVKEHHQSAVNLAFLSSQLAYRKGAYEEALRSLNGWIQSKDERPLIALMLHHNQSLPMGDFWRAMILAQLGQTDGAATAYSEGIQKLGNVGLTHVWVWGIYYSKALQQEAREVLRSQGIAAPETETKP